MRTSATANNNKDVRRQSMPQQQQQQQHQSQSQSRPQSKNFGTKSDIPVENRDNATLDSTEIDTSQFLYKCTKCRNRYAREVDLQIHVKARHGDEYETLVLTKSWEIKPSELKYLEKLGSGAYGIVFKARFKGELVCFLFVFSRRPLRRFNPSVFRNIGCCEAVEERRHRRKL